MLFCWRLEICFGLNAVQEIGLEAKALRCNAGHSAWSRSSLHILSAIFKR
ncbi:MAG: hypothetical protein QXS36_02935 [Candidatus Bathyarchaeia archaeon]